MSVDPEARGELARRMLSSSSVAILGHQEQLVAVHIIQGLLRGYQAGGCTTHGSTRLPARGSDAQMHLCHRIGSSQMGSSSRNGPRVRQWCRLAHTSHAAH